MRSKNVAFAATALSVALCGTAWADEAKEKALEQKLAEMQKQIDEMSRRMGDGSNGSNDELEQRVAELEKVTRKDQDGLFAYWKNGLRMDSVDGAFKLQIFGRIQTDFVWMDNPDENQDALGDTGPSVEFRRARIGLGGTIYKNVVYKAEYDFGDSGTGVANYADVFVEVKDPLCGTGINVRVGHFDEPFGLERLTSSRHSTFTERHLAEAFVPARNTGIMLYGQALDNQLSYFAGGFRDANAFGNKINSAGLGEHALTGRVAGRPWIGEDGAQWVHLGAAYRHQTPNGDSVQYRARPEIHVGPRFVDTGVLTDVESVDQWNLEAAGVFGPFCVYGEMSRPSLDGLDGAEDFDFRAHSLAASFFLTGENREYDPVMARFDRIKVKKNFGTDGLGAWEVKARYSHIDLNDGSVEGGDMTDWTFGLNWYLNPNTCVMFDWVRFDPDKAGEDFKSGSAFVVRFKVDF